MATYVSDATGNLITTTTWHKAFAGSSSIHATSNASISTSSDTFTATFTAPNTTNACSGAIFYLVTKNNATGLTVTLQEDLTGSGSWADTAATITVNGSDLPTAVVGSTNTGFFRARFATPYVFATTGAGRYRFKLRASGNTITLALAATGSVTFFLATDDESAAPGSTDQGYILGKNGTSTPVTVTIDSTTSAFYGTNVALANPANARVDNAGLYISIGGTLTPTTGSSTVLTYNGPIVVDGEGMINQDMSGFSYESTLRIQAISSATQGIFICPNGKDTFKGATFTQKVGYVSGVGTSADPIVLSSAPTGWNVDKEICITATGNGATNYNESEKRFIKSFPTSTTMVVSSTAGGAEAALTYTHTSAAEIIYAHANVIRDSADTKTWKYSNGAIVSNYVVWQYAKTDLSGGSGLANGLAMRTAPFGGAVSKLTLNNVVFYRPGRGDPSFSGNLDSTVVTHDAVTCLYGTSAITHIAGNGTPYISQSNTIFTNLVSVNCQGLGVTLAGSGNTITNPLIISSGLNAAGNVGIMVGGANNRIINPKINTTRGYGFYFSGAEDLAIINGGNGNNGINQSGNILCSATHNKVYFENVTQGSGTLITSYTSMLDGSEITFQKHNSTDNNHFWYTPYGKAELTGLTGCSDATTAANGNPTLTISPESITPGFTWKFQVLVRADSAAAILLKNEKNATFSTDDVVLNLYLPGSTTPDQTTTFPDDTSENTGILAQSYTGDVPLFCNVEVVAKSTTAGAKTRISNIFNGTNDIVNLKTWFKGKPATIQFEQLGDSQAVWQVLSTAANTSGTMGQKLNRSLSTGTFIALK